VLDKDNKNDQIEPPKGMPSSDKAKKGEFTVEDFQALPTEKDRENAKSLYNKMVGQSGKAVNTGAFTGTGVVAGLAIAAKTGHWKSGFITSGAALVIGGSKMIYHAARASKAEKELNKMKPESAQSEPIDSVIKQRMAQGR
jgi:hypothetical protein